jgi:hypothetical protein
MIANSESEFYIVLPSNVNCPTNTGKNKTSHYKTCLPSPIDVKKEEWEVALVQINYPFSWHNVSLIANEIVFKHYDKTRNEKEKIVSFPSNYYKTKEHILHEIELIKPNWFRGSFRINERTNKCEIIVSPFTEMSISKPLAALLGFGNRSNFKNSSMDRETILKRRPETVLAKDHDEARTLLFSARHGADMRGSMCNMYIYSNIVENTLLGNIFAPLLRLVAIDSEHGSYVSKVYNDPHYMKLQTGFIQEIEIKICDELGDLTRFEWGKIVIHLKFKRKNKF